MTHCIFIIKAGFHLRAFRVSEFEKPYSSEIGVHDVILHDSAVDTQKYYIPTKIN